MDFRFAHRLTLTCFHAYDVGDVTQDVKRAIGYPQVGSANDGGFVR